MSAFLSNDESPAFPYQVTDYIAIKVLEEDFKPIDREFTYKFYVSRNRFIDVSLFYQGNVYSVKNSVYIGRDKSLLNEAFAVEVKELLRNREQ